MLDERKQRAWLAARRAAATLKSDWGATRVLLYGSLAHDAWWHEHSDVDLAAEGIAPEDFWRAWGAVEHLGQGIEINLAPWESLKESVKQSVLREGVEL